MKMATRKKWIWNWFKPRLYRYTIELDGLALIPTQTPWKQTNENFSEDVNDYGADEWIMTLASDDKNPYDRFPDGKAAPPEHQRCRR